jgi:hypothetical protein
VSCASPTDTNLGLAATFHVWPAMLGDSLSLVKESTCWVLDQSDLSNRDVILSGAVLQAERRISRSTGPAYAKLQYHIGPIAAAKGNAGPTLTHALGASA